MRPRVRLIGAAGLLALLALTGVSCSTGNDDTNTLGSDPYVTEGGTPRVFAMFDPGIQVLPLPNDVVWAADGDPEVELEVGADDSAELAQLKQLVNAQGLLGLSPNMFLTVPVSGPVDAGTTEAIVFRTDDPQLPALLGALAVGDVAAAGAAVQDMVIRGEIRTEGDFLISAETGLLKLAPLDPFTPGAAYAAVLRSGLVDGEGFEVAPSIAMRALKRQTPFGPSHPYARFEPIRAGFNDPNPETGAPSLFDVVAAVTGARLGAAWSRDDVLVLWTFHTADRTLSLTPTDPDPANRTLAYADIPGFPGAFRQVSQAWPDLFPGADQGVTITGDFAPAEVMPAGAPQDALGRIYFGSFLSPDLASSDLSNPLAPVVETGTVTFLLAVPAEGPGPFPVVVFQHGIGSQKETAFGLANALAGRGIATLAIDAPYHGQRAPEGTSSGELFLSPNLLLVRLNGYQAAMDLWETFDAVAAIDAALPAVDLDETALDLAGHSLGSMLASVFLSQDARPGRVLLSNPAALFANALDETRNPEFSGLVDAFGFTRGTTDYLVFLDLAQWLLDPVDSGYLGIGATDPDRVLGMFALGDPIVSDVSSRIFLHRVGIGVTTVDPALIVPGAPETLPPPDPGGYQYGATDPVIHSFLLTPSFDPATEPWYEGYDADIQLRAYVGAQAQAAGFFAGD